MTPNNIINFILAAVAASGLVIVPLARIIPWKLMTNWRATLIEDGGAPDALVEADFQLSMQYKAGICAAGAAIGLLASFAYTSHLGAAMFCLYFLGMILLAAINLKHFLLPDVVVFTLLWIGMLYSGGTAGNTAEHVSGAAIAYLGAHLLMTLVKLATGKEFLGHGDPKALAMAGAWFGMSALPFIFGVFIAATIVLALLAAVLRRTTVGTGPAHLLTSLGYVIVTRIL